MAMMMGSLYDTLVESGTSADFAKKAAEEVASYDSRSAKVENELGIVKWMVGFNVAMTAAILAKLLI